MLEFELIEIDPIEEQTLEPWDPETHYRKKMHTLLWMEEAQQNKLLTRFNKRDVYSFIKINPN